MIFVLSCFDLVVVMVAHPTTISLATAWYRGDDASIHWSNQEKSDKYDLVEVTTLISNCAQAFSAFALLVMTTDRYMAITRPLFHKTSATKPRLLAILATMSLLYTAARVTRLKNLKAVNYSAAIVFSAVSQFFLLLMNCRMFVIAAKAKKNKQGGKFKTQLRLLKKNSTCLLAAGCSFACAIPGIVYGVLKATTNAVVDEDDLLLIRLWVYTCISMSSSFNCLIFFWKNTILRNEGKKLLPGCLKHTN